MGFYACTTTRSEEFITLRGKRHFILYTTAPHHTKNNHNTKIDIVSLTGIWSGEFLACIPGTHRKPLRFSSAISTVIHHGSPRFVLLTPGVP